MSFYFGWAQMGVYIERELHAVYHCQCSAFAA